MAKNQEFITFNDTLFYGLCQYFCCGRNIELFCIILNSFGENGNNRNFFIKNTICIIKNKRFNLQSVKAIKLYGVMQFLESLSTEIIQQQSAEHKNKKTHAE